MKLKERVKVLEHLFDVARDIESMRRSIYQLREELEAIKNYLNITASPKPTMIKLTKGE